LIFDFGFSQETPESIQNWFGSVVDKNPRFGSETRNDNIMTSAITGQTAASK